jgi:hypothetical protein
VLAAVSAPKSHPEPMIEPSEMNIRPIKPTSRRKPGCPRCVILDVVTARQVTVAQQMYDEKDVDGKRRYTVAEIAETFHVSRKTIYRHLEPTPAATPPSPTR